MAQGEALQGRSHFGDLPNLFQIEERHTNAAPGLADHEALSLQTAEGLAYGHVACTELHRNVILSQLASGLQLTRDDALGQRTADPAYDRVVRCFGIERCHASEIIY